MTFNLSDPANHPANDRLTNERLIRVRDELQRTLTYKNGSAQDYVTADAIKALDELLGRRKADVEVEKGASEQLRDQIRNRHAEWSENTFGDVGPVGPLKHLSEEALEAATDIDDLSEWADMQFLLWDAQRRAGISDGEITAAMEEKLKVNMQREWPEPKDGEPRLHIRSAPQEDNS